MLLQSRIKRGRCLQLLDYLATDVGISRWSGYRSFLFSLPLSFLLWLTLKYNFTDWLYLYLNGTLLVSQDESLIRQDCSENGCCRYLNTRLCKTNNSAVEHCFVPFVCLGFKRYHLQSSSLVPPIVGLLGNQSYRIRMGMVQFQFDFSPTT